MPSYDDALKVTTEMLARHLDAGRPVKPADHIQNDLGLDSLAVMEVVADLEDHFNISIPAASLEGVATVDDVARTLTKF